MAEQKITRGNASQFFVAGELCRRGYPAVVTLGNTPNVDILCSNIEGTRFAFIQVKTFVPGNRTCAAGLKAEIDFGNNFFWILAGIPLPKTEVQFEYYIIPSPLMSKNIKESHIIWHSTPGNKGQQRNQTSMRNIALPPHKLLNGWNISEYRDRWDLIEEKLKT